MAATYYDRLEAHYEDYYFEYYDELYNGSYNGTYPTYQEYPMDIFNPIFFSESLLCTTIAIALIEFIFCRIYLCRKQSKERSHKIVIRLALFCLISHTLHCITDSIAYYLWYIQYDTLWADIADLTWDIFWFLGRASLYLLFLYQYYKIYNASSAFHPYQKRSKYVIFSTLALMYFIQIASFGTVSYFWYAVDIYDDEWSKQMMLTADAIFIVVDFIFVGTMTYLLCNSILKLIVYRVNSTNVNVTPPQQNIPTKSVAANEVQSISSEPIKETQSLQTSPEPQIRRRRSTKSKSNDRELLLIHSATRIALSSFISMISTLIYSVLWHIAVDLENVNLMWSTVTWNIDSIVNMFCVYFMMELAEDHYKILCVDICKCHSCCLRFVVRFIESETRMKLYQEESLVTGSRSSTSVSSEGKESSSALPKLVKDVSNVRNCERTFS